MISEPGGITIATLCIAVTATPVVTRFVTPTPARRLRTTGESLGLPDPAVRP